MPQRHQRHAPPVPQFRRFPTQPWHLKADFLAHVRNTGEPETFPGIHPGPLSKSEPFQIIVPFDVDATKRPNGDWAPCPMCRHPNKYLSGRFVYLPRLQAISAIGCECANVENSKAAVREYRAHLDRTKGENYLLENLHLVPSCMRVVENAMPTAIEIRRICRLFKNKGAPIRDRLAQISRDGGRLLLSEEIPDDLAATGPRGFGSSGGRDTRDVELGLLKGSTALLREYDPAKELQRIATSLAPLQLSSSDDETLELLLRAPPREITLVATRIREAAKAYERFRERLHDATAFFANDNLQLIAAWGRHPLQPDQFTLELLSERGLQVLHLDGTASYMKAVISPLIWLEPEPWPIS